MKKYSSPLRYFMVQRICVVTLCVILTAYPLILGGRGENWVCPRRGGGGCRGGWGGVDTTAVTEGMEERR